MIGGMTSGLEGIGSCWQPNSPTAVIYTPSTPDEFKGLVNSQEWQEDHLLSYQVYQLHQRGLVPGHRQCYGFAPHPIFTGRIDIDTVMIMDILAWQSICAQAIGPKLNN